MNIPTEDKIHYLQVAHTEFEYEITFPMDQGDFHKLFSQLVTDRRISGYLLMSNRSIVKKVEVEEVEDEETKLVKLIDSCRKNIKVAVDELNDARIKLKKFNDS